MEWRSVFGLFLVIYCGFRCGKTCEWGIIIIFVLRVIFQALRWPFLYALRDCVFIWIRLHPISVVVTCMWRVTFGSFSFGVGTE